jgi:hypothetical protein
MRDWLINLFGYICALLIIASMFGGYIKLYDRVRGIVMFFINIPHNAHAFIAEAKKRLAPDNKVPTNKTNRDGVSDPARAALQDRSHEAL